MTQCPHALWHQGGKLHESAGWTFFLQARDQLLIIGSGKNEAFIKKNGVYLVIIWTPGLSFFRGQHDMASKTKKLMLTARLAQFAELPCSKFDPELFPHSAYVKFFVKFATKCDKF